MDYYAEHKNPTHGNIYGACKTLDNKHNIMNTYIEKIVKLMQTCIIMLNVFLPQQSLIFST